MLNVIRSNATVKPSLGAEVQRGHPLCPSLLWLFNEGQSARALSHIIPSTHGGTTNAGVLTNGAFYVTTPMGGGVQFDGVDDQIANGLLVPSYADDLTISVLWRTTSVGTGRIFDLAQTGGTGGLQVLMNVGVIQTNNAGGPTSAITTSPTTYNDNKVHRIHVTRQGTTYTLYVNGLLIGTSGGAAPTYTRLNVGKAAAGTSPIAGQVMEVYLLPRALTPGDVARHYARPYSYFIEAGQPRYWIPNVFPAQTLTLSPAAAALTALAASLAPGAATLNAAAAQAALAAVTAALSSGAKSVLLSAAEATALASLGVLSAGTVTLTGTAAPAVLSAVTAIIQRGGPAVQYHASVADVREYTLRVEC